MSMLPSTAFIGLIYGLLTGSTHYLALYTTSPGAGDTGTEVTGGSYARQAITWGSIVGSTLSNSGAITFSGVPAATITHFGIRSASTGGTLKLYGALNSSVATISGDEVIFPTGNLTINLAGS